MVGFYQTLIITIKYEVGPRVFLYPIAFCMMRSKSSQAYIEVLKDLQRIHSLYNVDSSPLNPNQLSHDFETGMISGFYSVFPYARKRLCLFHHKQSVNRLLQQIFGKDLHKLPIVKYLRRILGVYPILPLHVPQVRFAVIEHLEFIAENLTRERKVKLHKHIQWIERSYFNENHLYSHTNAEHFEGILEESTDCSSSSAESINSKFNATFSNGKKSLASVLYTIHEFKKQNYELKMERLSENNLRARPPSFLARKLKLVELCTEFNSLHPDIQGRDLVPFMIEIMYL